MKIDLEKLLQRALRLAKLFTWQVTGYSLIALGLCWIHPAWALIFVGFVLATWSD
jgi:hypothetical protein